MVRNLSSLQTYQIKDMIERAPVYQKSSYQKQVISSINFKIIPITKNVLSPANRFYPSITQQHSASAHNDFRKSIPQINTQISSATSYANKAKPNVITIEALLMNKKSEVGELAKFNNQRMIKLSHRSKPVFTPVKQNNTSIKDQQVTTKPPIPSPRLSISPRSLSSSPAPTIKSTKTKIDTTLTNKNQTEIKSRPVSRSSISHASKSNNPPISILKQTINEESGSSTITKTTFTRRRFSKSSFSSALNDINSTTGTINENLLNEICEQPKTHHMTSFLSIDAQYATLKVYEDIMHRELVALFPHLDYLPRVSSARFSKSSISTSNTSNSVLSTYSDKNSILNSKQVKPQVEFTLNSEESRKLKVTHFIESAMQIIDAMEHFKKRKNSLSSSLLTPKKLTSNFSFIERSLTNRGGIFEEDDLIETYLKWIDLWNKYLDEQSL